MKLRFFKENHMNTIGKIDLHAHVRPTDPAYDGKWLDGKALLEIYDALGIEKGVILPFLSLKGNGGVLTSENAKKVCEEFPERFVRFTTLSLDSETVNGKIYEEYLREEKESGALGVGEITTKVYFDSEPVKKLFEACGKLNLPVLFHMAKNFDDRYGVVDDMGLPRMEKMLKAYPEVSFIGHAVPFWSEISVMEDEALRGKRNKDKVVEGRLAHLLRTCPNLYCDLSAGSGSNAMMRDEDYAASFLEEFSDRILYGCDICCAGQEYPFAFRDFLDGLREKGKITEGTYFKVCRGNAERLLGI